MPGIEDEQVGVEEDDYLRCKCSREDDIKIIRSAMRKTAFLTAVCGVLCVLTIVACGCSLYFYTRFQEFRQDLAAMVRADTDDTDDVWEDHFPLDHNAMPMYGGPPDEYDDDFQSKNTRQIRDKGKTRKGKSRKDGGKVKKGNKAQRKKCSGKKMNTCDCCKRTLDKHINEKFKELESQHQRHLEPSGQMTTPKPQVPTTKPDVTNEEKKPTYVSAAHYTTYVNEEYINEQFGPLEHDLNNNKPKNENNQATEAPESDEEMWVNKHEWNGILYRNRTFVTTDAPITLRFFKEADWMKNSTTAKLFDFDQSSGKFTAKQTGLYHLYAHVLFYEVKTRMAIGLLHECKKGLQSESKGKETIVFRCMESVDYVGPQFKVGHNAKFKSCSVNGVLFMNHGDNIALQSLYKSTCIDLSYGATYFGAIYISTPTS